MNEVVPKLTLKQYILLEELYTQEYPRVTILKRLRKEKGLEKLSNFQLNMIILER